MKKSGGETDLYQKGAETIKSIETRRYVIQLMQARSGLYYVVYEQPHDEQGPCSTDGIQDFFTASSVFDTILMDLEGH